MRNCNQMQRSRPIADEQEMTLRERQIYPAEKVAGEIGETAEIGEPESFVAG